MPITYSADALIFDSGTGSWSLRGDYDHTQHRIEITFTDDDGFLSGDASNNEAGDDANQSATVTDMQGNPVASGQVYAEEFRVIDTVGGAVRVDFIEIGGVLVGYSVTEALVPGQSYPQLSSGNVTSSNESAYSSFVDVTCFAPDTLIETERGQVPAREIRPGDRVLTLDNGLQRVLWAGSQTVRQPGPGQWPVRLNVLLPGTKAPFAPLCLSAQHRVLLSDPWFDLVGLGSEVLAPACGLAQATPPDVPVTWCHLLFARHEIIRANGLWIESLFSGGSVFDRLPPIHRIAAAQALKGKRHRQTARPCLRRWEAKLFLRDNAPAIPRRCAA